MYLFNYKTYLLPLTQLLPHVTMETVSFFTADPSKSQRRCYEISVTPTDVKRIHHIKK